MRARLTYRARRKETWWKRHATSVQDRLKIKLKILFSFYQIATGVGTTYVVNYPQSVEHSLNALSFVNLELEGLGLPLACMGMGGFRQKLLFIIIAPLGILVLTKVVGWFQRDRNEEREVREKHSQAREALSGRSSTHCVTACWRISVNVTPATFARSSRRSVVWRWVVEACCS